MALLHEDDWSLGWQPSLDAIKGSRLGVLRMDNLVEDEVGVLGLRLGSHTINPGGTPLRSPTSIVRSLFSATINGTKYRYAAVDDGTIRVAFRNFTSFGSFDGDHTLDILFGSFQGMLLATGGTTHWKNDGVNTRTWGIAAPAGAPTISLLDPRVIVVSDFGNTDFTAWKAVEGQTIQAIGHERATNGSISVTPSSTSGKGTIQKDYAAPQNFNSFDSGAAVGAPEDTIEFYAWIANPDALELISISFDVNPNSASPFQDDYYYFEFVAGDAVSVQLDNRRVLDGRPDIELPDRERIGDSRRPDRPTRTRPRDDTPADDNSGWSKFTILRGQAERVGSTPGCDWNTVKSVQLNFKYQIPDQGGVVGTVKFDDLRILGGSDRTLTGKFRVRYIWTRVFDNYTALSGPSPMSDEVDCKNNAIVVTAAGADSAAADSQVHEPGGQMWAYIGGGTMTSFYRGGVADSQSSGPISVTCTDSERDMILADILLQTDNQPPPNNIIGIIGPHYNRILCLTKKELWVGQEGNPDSFSLAQVLEVADPAEEALWGIKASGVVYIGTTRDVYRLTGTLALLPDGTPDARLEPMGINGPPIGSFVAQDGGMVVYISADGFRMLQGGGSAPINWNLDLLIQGYTRHGASLSIAPTSGRISGGFFNGRLYVNVGGSNYVYVADFAKKRWRRAQYPRAFFSLFREADGPIVAGDGVGMVWQIETQDAGDFALSTSTPASAAMPITLWTTSSDGGAPLQYKEGYDWRADLMTGSDTTKVNVQLFLDEVAGPNLSVGGVAYGTVQQTLGSNVGMHPFKRVQHKITGNVNYFKLGSISLTYRPRPTPLLYWDSSHLDWGAKGLVWFRELRLKVRCAVSLRVRILFGGVTFLDKTLTLTPNQEDIYPLDIGRECKGKLPLMIVEPSTGLTDLNSVFELYWVAAKFKTTGGVTEKTYQVQEQGLVSR